MNARPSSDASGDRALFSAFAEGTGRQQHADTG